MNEFEKMFTALSQTTPESVIREVYRMFDSIQRSGSMEDGIRLVSLFNTVAFYKENIPSDSKLTKAALTKLLDAIVIKIRIIEGDTASGFFQSSNELEKLTSEMCLEEYELSSFNEEE